MIAITNANFASSEPNHRQAALGRIVRGIRQYLPSISRGQDYTQLVSGFEQMADVRSAAGDENGAQYYTAHVTAVREAIQQN